MKNYKFSRRLLLLMCVLHAVSCAPFRSSVYDRSIFDRAFPPLLDTYIPAYQPMYTTPLYIDEIPDYNGLKGAYIPNNKFGSSRNNWMGTLRQGKVQKRCDVEKADCKKGWFVGFGKR